jgi:hypothetical protein
MVNQSSPRSHVGPLPLHDTILRHKTLPTQHLDLLLVFTSIDEVVDYGLDHRRPVPVGQAVFCTNRL